MDDKLRQLARTLVDHALIEIVTERYKGDFGKTFLRVELEVGDTLHVWRSDSSHQHSFLADLAALSGYLDELDEQEANG